MAVRRSDQYWLGQSAVFQHMVQASLMSACVAIQSENPSTTVFHRERAGYVAQITGSIPAWNDAVQRHAFAAAGFTAVINDATANGTVAINSTASGDTQAPLVTDADLDTAISSQFNTFFRTPGI
jgi:hypothetical protein